MDVLRRITRSQITDYAITDHAITESRINGAGIRKLAADRGSGGDVDRLAAALLAIEQKDGVRAVLPGGQTQEVQGGLESGWLSSLLTGHWFQPGDSLHKAQVNVRLAERFTGVVDHHGLLFWLELRSQHRLGWGTSPKQAKRDERTKQRARSAQASLHGQAGEADQHGGPRGKRPEGGRDEHPKQVG